MTSLHTPSQRHSLPKILILVTTSALRSTLVITLVAVAVFALREQVFDGPTLLRVTRDHQLLFILVFVASWIWRFWQAQRTNRGP
ncbi:MAG TPA: hypothetical protein VGD88_13925 [Opitutaceae bacterium]